MAKKTVFELLNIPATLPSEYQILSQPGLAPALDSQKYLQVVEVDGDQIVFNSVDNSRKAIQTKNVTVSGVNVVLEDSSATPLFTTLHNRTNLKNLTICADVVVVGSPLALPGTTVSIYARELQFKATGSINTTPLAVTMLADQNPAQDGAPAGKISLYVKAIVAPDNTRRLTANGGKGQPAQPGERGADGTDVTAWSGKFDTRTIYSGNEVMSWESEIKNKTNGYTPVHATLDRWTFSARKWVKVESGAAKYERSHPGDGGYPKRSPGKPGRGGAGGDVASRFPEVLGPRTEQKPGEPGTKAIDVQGTRGGYPEKSCKVEMGFYADWFPSTKAHVDGNGILNTKVEGHEFSVFDQRTTSGRPGALAPEAEPAGPAGKQVALERTDEAFWLHPLAVQALIGYTRDAYRAGQTQAIRPVVDQYLAAIASLDSHTLTLAAEQPHLLRGSQETSFLPIEFTTLHGELKALVQQIDSPFDYFGKPAGWVPVLSFESNLEAFKQETHDAIARLYLSYWMEHNQASAEARAKSIRTTLTQLQEETAAAIKTYNAGELRLEALNNDYAALGTSIGKFFTDLEGMEKDLRRKTKYLLEGEKVLRAAGKILGGVAQIVPVGQPALGAVGKGLGALADWDSEEPLDSVKHIGGAVWDSDLIKDKLLPKIKAAGPAFLGIKTDGEKESKEAKESTEKETEFSKELKKQELSEKVKKHMKEQSEAKEQVTKAFGSILVSKDELDAAVKKALADCPEYQELADKLEKLNAKKSELAEALLTIAQLLDDAATTIVNNRLTEIELRGALATAAKNLSPEGLRYTRVMGQRALERLQRYEYYFVKSYLYLWLEAVPKFDMNSEYIFEELKRVLQPASEAVLSGAQFDRLGVVFRENLKKVGDQLLTYYNTEISTQREGEHTKTHFTLQLSARHLAALNSKDKAVAIDLMAEGKLHLSLEDVRIYDVEAIQATLIDPPDKAFDVRLRVKHPSDSILRRRGKVHLFRNTQRSWGTLVSRADKKSTLSPEKPDPVEDSIIRTLLGMQPSDAPLRSLPSAWSTVVLERTLMDERLPYDPTFSAITLKVYYTARDLDSSHVSLYVGAPASLSPVIECSPADINGRSKGEGRFLRTYHKQTTQVTLTAPAAFGDYVFLGWRARDVAVKDDPSKWAPLIDPEAAKDLDDFGKLARDPKLVVNLSTHQFVEAVYLLRAGSLAVKLLGAAVNRSEAAAAG